MLTTFTELTPDPVSVFAPGQRVRLTSYDEFGTVIDREGGDQEEQGSPDDVYFVEVDPEYLRDNDTLSGMWDDGIREVSRRNLEAVK